MEYEGYTYEYLDLQAPILSIYLLNYINILCVQVIKIQLLSVIRIVIKSIKGTIEKLYKHFLYGLFFLIVKLYH